jgi:hypothetical protein
VVAIGSFAVTPGIDYEHEHLEVISVSDQLSEESMEWAPQLCEEKSGPVRKPDCDQERVAKRQPQSDQLINYTE